MSSRRTSAASSAAVVIVLRWRRRTRARSPRPACDGQPRPAQPGHRLGQVGDPHQDHDRAAQPDQRLEFVGLRRRVPGDHREGVADPAVGDRDPAGRRAPTSALDTPGTTRTGTPAPGRPASPHRRGRRRTGRRPSAAPPPGPLVRGRPAARSIDVWLTGWWYGDLPTSISSAPGASSSGRRSVPAGRRRPRRPAAGRRTPPGSAGWSGPGRRPPGVT